MKIMATSDLHGNLEGLDPKDAGIVTAKIDEQKTDATREKILELVKEL